MSILDHVIEVELKARIRILAAKSANVDVS